MTFEERIDYPRTTSITRRVVGAAASIVGEGIYRAFQVFGKAIIFGDIKRQDLRDYLKREGLSNALRELRERSVVEAVLSLPIEPTTLRGSQRLRG